MSRPKKADEMIIKRRNKLILVCLKDFSQTETAKVFRLPRNTVSIIARRNA